MARAMLIGCMVLLGGVANAASLAPPPPGVDLVHIVARPMRASALVGMPVREASGAPAGWILDLVFDTARNRVRHALVGLREGMFAVSLFDLRLSLERRYLRLRPERQDVVPASHRPDASRASDWLGRAVYGKSGVRLGRIEDALIDVHDGEVAFVLLEQAARLHPLPLDAIRSERQRLELDIDPARLQPQRSFTRTALAANIENDAFLTAHAAYADGLTRVDP